MAAASTIMHHRLAAGCLAWLQQAGLRGGRHPGGSWWGAHICSPAPSAASARAGPGSTGADTPSLPEGFTRRVARPPLPAAPRDFLRRSRERMRPRRPRLAGSPAPQAQHAPVESALTVSALLALPETCAPLSGGRQQPGCRAVEAVRKAAPGARQGAWRSTGASSGGRAGQAPSMDSVVLPLRDFAKNSIRLVKRCTKPDRRGVRPWQLPRPGKWGSWPCGGGCDPAARAAGSTAGRRPHAWAQVDRRRDRLCTLAQPAGLACCRPAGG